jgi:hypothetical protein
MRREPVIPFIGAKENPRRQCRGGLVLAYRPIGEAD